MKGSWPWRERAAEPNGFQYCREGDAMLTPAIRSKIDQLWNKFWSGGISNPLTAIEQITYLLFMKRLDDLDLKRKSDAEFTGDKYASKFEGVWILPEERNRPTAEQ